MANLSDIFADLTKKEQVVDACCELIDQEVGDKGGISGLAIKAGYGAIKGVKPGFVRKVVSDLLPEFAKALEPLVAEALTNGTPISRYLETNAGRAADALLQITDSKASRSQSAVVKGTYDKLRGSAKKNVEQAIPRLAKLIEHFMK